MFHEKYCVGKHRSDFNVIYSQPECFAPHVDITRAKCAYGRGALPKLVKMLNCFLKSFIYYKFSEFF